MHAWWRDATRVAADHEPLMTRVAEQPTGMVEEEEQNALLRTAVMTGI